MPCSCLRSRAGWECRALQRDFPLAKEEREWAGASQPAQSPCWRVLPSSPDPRRSPLPLWGCPAFSGLGGWGGGGGGGKGQPARIPGFWECLGTKPSRALGRLLGWRRSAAEALLPHPRPTGGPLGAPSADNTETLSWGGSPGKRGNQTKRENNKPRISDNNSGSKHPPAPWGDSEGFSCPLIPRFPQPLPNTSITGQEALALRWRGKLWLFICFTWSQGVSEKPVLGRVR